MLFDLKSNFRIKSILPMSNDLSRLLALVLTYKN